jgi:hypothetical protein
LKVACGAGGIRGHERMGSLKYRLPKNDTFWVLPGSWVPEHSDW